MRESTNRFRIGLVADARAELGYGHAVRCLRIARAFQGDAAIYPMSEECRRFFKDAGLDASICDWKNEVFPGLMITDLRESYAVTEAIQQQGSIHVSIRDMGLAQCRADIAIDGSVATAIPYAQDPTCALFLGPRYMITRPTVARMPEKEIENTVLVTLGGGASADFSKQIAEKLWPLGLRVVTTAGFHSGAHLSDSEIEHAMATCRFAISTAGTTLYDLLASGVPTIAVSLDPLQLRTADTFHDLGATVSAGILDRISSSELLDRCREFLGKSSLVSQMVSAGQKLVDGNGLSRVVEIVRNPGREIWKIHQTLTSTAC